ncbi:hypothetical protein ABK040_010350 [Willaertia magna]
MIKSFLPLFQNVPIIAKVIIFIQTCLFLLSFIINDTIHHYFSLIPQNTLTKFFLHNLITSSLLETEPFSFIFTILSVIITSKWIINKNILLSQQPQTNVWNTNMYLWFLFVVTLSCGILTLIFAILSFFILSNILSISVYDELVKVLLYSRFHGFHGCIIGFTLIMKQQVPEEFPLQFLQIRGRDVPFVALVISIVLSIITLQFTDLPFIIFGFLVSYIYLRFYQTRDDGLKGDHSDSFAFHTLFPELIQTPIRIISSLIYSICKRFKIVGELRRISSNDNNNDKDGLVIDIISSSPISESTTTTSSSNSTTSTMVTNKRRELAIQELDKRLSQHQQQQEEQINTNNNNI